MATDDEVRLLIGDLDKVPKELRRQLGRTLRKAAEPIAAKARGNAAWSTRIPGAISVRAQFAGQSPGVTVRVSAARAPHGRPIENLGRGGTFRHPVYGDRNTWVDQAARPFLFPAAAGAAATVIAEIADAIDTSARLHGWR